MSADTNPLRDKRTYPDSIYDAAIAAHRALGAEPNRDWIATVITNAVLDVLAEFIGDGLLDGELQCWTKRTLGSNIVAPIVVLERSETDQ